MDTLSHAEAVLDRLRAGGIERATHDPRNINPPCAFLDGFDSLARSSQCGWVITWQLRLLAPGPFNADAWKVLDGLLTQAIAVTKAPDVSWDPNFPIANGTAPCWLLTFTEVIG